MTKIIIEIEGGLVTAVHSTTSDLQYVIVDNDLPANGEAPVSEVLEPDSTFTAGCAHLHYVMNDNAEQEIRDELKRIKF